MANYLITGYHGEPHVTAENERGIHQGIVGAGRYVLPTGEQFRAEYIGNNTIRMYDGKLMDNGAAAGIPAGEYIDFQIANAGQNMNRNDLIVFQYEKDTSTLIETGSFVVVSGKETSGTAADPSLTQNDLLGNYADVTLEQMPLWRVKVTGTSIGTPESLYTVSGSIMSGLVAGAAEGDIPAFDANGALVDSGVNVANVTFAKMTLSGTTLYIETVS